MLNEKVAVITGGSRGIGAAISEKLASQGASIAIVDFNEEAAVAECAKISEKYAVKALPYHCDVSDYEATKAVVSAIKQDFGTVDILVNDAGINRDGLIAMMSEQNFDDVIATNLKGTFNMIRHCSPLFIRNHGGKIINISSVAGIMGNAGQVNYAASKAGIIGVTKSVAKELAAKNVTCNAIAPGFIRTDMTKDFDESNPLVAIIPLKRMGEPKDIANTAAFLASSDADYITGVVLRVDGGSAM